MFITLTDYQDMHQEPAPKGSDYTQNAITSFVKAKVITVLIRKGGEKMLSYVEIREIRVMWSNSKQVPPHIIHKVLSEMRTSRVIYAKQLRKVHTVRSHERQACQTQDARYSLHTLTHGIPFPTIIRAQQQRTHFM